MPTRPFPSSIRPRQNTRVLIIKAAPRILSALNSQSLDTGRVT
jgi:hypothetical protein